MTRFIHRLAAAAAQRAAVRRLRAELARLDARLVRDIGLEDPGALARRAVRGG